jgi:pectate lyase
MTSGTTGGGTDLGSAVTVSSMADLQGEAAGPDAKIILVEPGTYNGELAPGPNKTIVGTAPGVMIHGGIMISGEEKTNIIIRNMAIRQDKCGSHGDCQSGTDAVYIGRSAHHVWLDHMDIADGQDGNCDITRQGDYVTVSWTKFHYTYDKAHAFSNLIAGSGGETESRGKLQITYMNCWWGDNVDQRQPMGRFGKIHMLNNYHKNDPTFIHEVNRELSLIAENCYYDIPGKSIFRGNKGPTGYKGIGNEGTADGLDDSFGTVFDIPYSYTAMSATEARDAITSPDCGAGNTCQLMQ